MDIWVLIESNNKAIIKCSSKDRQAIQCPKEAILFIFKITYNTFKMICI